MRILFYLPVVTPWWFENIVEPMIRRAADVAEVHVLAPAPWRNTGLGPDELRRCVDLAQVHWAIVDGDDHPSLRTAPADRAGLIDYVTALAPDIILCRTSDFETVRDFPGAVRFLMEVAIAPFAIPDYPVSITDAPFVNGAMPALSPHEEQRLDTLIAPLWAAMQAHWQATIPPRDVVFRHAGIAGDRPVILLPLEYEHEENFFLGHRVGPADTRELVRQIASRVTPGCTLVVTDHPLNIRFVGDRGLAETIERLGAQVVKLGAEICGVPVSMALAPYLDGMILCDSKSFGIAAAFGIPIVRRSRFASADWLNSETNLDRFVTAVRGGSARAPSQADARRWFAYHFGNEAFDPKSPALTGDEIVARALHPTDPDRWESGIAAVRPAKAEFLA